MNSAGRRLAVVMLGVSGCGYGSINPILSDADTECDPHLVGTWQDLDGKESVIITSDTGKGYALAYGDEEGKTGQFHARLGHGAG